MTRWLAVALVACSPDTSEAPAGPALPLGMSAPLSGPLAGYGAGFRGAAELAVASINAAGGVEGRALELTVLDSGGEPARGAEACEQLAAAGAVAMIGPGLSTEVRAALPCLQRHGLVAVSGSSTVRAGAVAEDGGLLFRDVGHNDLQARALAYFIAVVEVRSRVVIAFADDEFGASLEAAFAPAFVARGGVVAARVPFADGAADAAVWASASAALAQVPASDTLVFLGGTGDALALLGAWQADGAHPALRWRFSDSQRNPDFAAAAPAGSPPGSIRGTAPTHALGAAYDAYLARLPPGAAPQDAYQPHYFDAVHLVALGLARQLGADPGVAPGGPGLAAALLAVGSSAGVQRGASDWPAALAAAAAGEEGGYDGAGGPCDFDAAGEAPSPFELWDLAGGAFGVAAAVAPDAL